MNLITIFFNCWTELVAMADGTLVSCVVCDYGDYITKVCG